MIIGGQALSLLITLLITPVAYSLFDDLGRLQLLRRFAALRPVRLRPAAGEPEATPPRAASAP